MGLLSDPEYGSLRWVRILKRFHTLFSFACYFGGLAWFCMLACKEFNNETYFSENALLPGLATNEFNAEAANHYNNEFLQELEDKYSNTDEMPVPWLVAKMSQLHLEVYTHNFTLNYPLGQGQTFVGTNVYGILRAPRTSSLEALVLSAPYRPLSSHLKGTTVGIALMLAFAQFARPQKYWAKDIIFLVTEHEQLGMQAWLEAYHGLKSEPGNFYTSLGSFYKPGMPTLDLGKLTNFQWSPAQSKCLDPGKLTGRSGSIQAAINLELHKPVIKYVTVKVEGLNGQLPNLDLVNLVLKLCMKSGIHHSFKNSYSWMRNRHKSDDWLTSMYTILGMAQAQVTGVPNGNHGLFHRFGIEAVTIEGRDASDDPTVPTVNALVSSGLQRLGAALESIVRSMNNLLERFHQSYFFYLLTATNRFISIGQYMPSLCLMCVALLVRALGIWVSMQKDLDDDPDTKEDEKNTQTAEKDTKEKEKTTDTKDTEKKEAKSKKKLEEKEKEDRAKEKRRSELSFSIVNIGANYLLVHLLGYLAMNSPFVFSKIGTYYDLPSEKSVFYGLVFISTICTILAPRLFAFLLSPMDQCGPALVNMLLLIELATALLAIGMHNYLLAFLLATVATPLALLVRVAEDDSSRRARFAQSVLCLLHQPLLLLTLGMVGYACLMFPEDSPGSLVTRGLDAVAQAAMFAVVDSMIYGNWLFNVATLVLFPAWLVLWQIARAPPSIPSSGNVHIKQD